ncbi:MAG TPA: trypsin-like peptidase domain-containing protein [Ktedonobacterales bacterium]
MPDVPTLGARRAGPRRLPTLVALGLCAALACVWALASAPLVAAAPAHPADSVAQQAVQVDSPAVVRIVSVVNASLTCAGCASNGSDIHSPSDGGTFTYYSSGSGAFISPDGAILTADHVVDHSMNNPEEVTFIEQQAAQDIAQNFNTTAGQALTYLQNNPAKVSITFQVVFQKAFLSTAYTGNLPDTRHIYAFPITSTLASSQVSKQDTAIVKIDTSGIKPAPDFPYLTLANSPVSALDPVTAIAFPADADLALNNTDFTALANPGSSDVNTINSLLSPSVNSGAITKANEVRPDGTLVYEANSIASNGSSGGPVINNQGQMIGFVDAGTSTDRLTFIISSAAVAKLAGQAGVSTATQGRFMGLWTKAMTEYNATTSCHWTSAEADLTALKTQYPTFGAVAPYLAQA